MQKDETLYVRRFTLAPKDYDYGSTYETKVIGKFQKYNSNMVDIREIFIDKERLEYQVGRNQSGLFPTWTREELQIEVNFGHIEME